MATARFDVLTPLSPRQVLGALTDFSDRRPEIYGNIDQAHFRVHGQGPGWADVTEGNALAWERNRYDWDDSAGTVSVKAMESNTWASGSGWEYRLTPEGGGTRVDVSLIRIPKTMRGRLIAALVPLLGRRVLRADLLRVLSRVRS